MPAQLPAPPPSVIVPAPPRLPPLSFIGFTAGMHVSEAQRLTGDIGGALTCRSTTDSRIRECNGSLPFLGLRQPFDLLVSTVNDSAAVIVITGTIPPEDTRIWVRALTEDFGVPNYRREHGVQESWQWIRRGQMLRVMLHHSGSESETAVTLTHGPLLDGLGPPIQKKAGR